MTTLADEIVAALNDPMWDAHAEVPKSLLRAIFRALRERNQAVEALREIDALDGEINPSNYDHDDACYLNRQFCYAGTVARTTLASIEGTGHDD